MLDRRGMAASPPLPLHGRGLPYWGSRAAYARDPLGFFREGYLRHGPLFRTRQLGTTYHVMAGPEATDFIYQHNDLWDYALARAHFRENFSDRYLPQLNGPPHRRKRRRLAPGFKPGALMAHFPAMTATVLRRVDAHGGAPVDLRALTRDLVTAMTSTAFLRQDLPDGIGAAIAAFEHDLLKGGSYGSFRHLWYARPSYRRNRERVFAALGGMLDRRTPPGPGGLPDLLGAMLADADPEDPPATREEVIHDVAMFYLAGSDATSSVILWTLLFLATDPAWAGRLRTELAGWDPARVFGLADFPLLKATITEVERLRPPFPTFGRAAQRDFEFAGRVVPRGRPIIHAISVPHFLAETFPEPFRFRPDRFLEQPDAARSLGLFGGRAHACLGQPLARIQETLAVAALVRHYDLALLATPSLAVRFDGVIMPVEATLPARLVRRP